MDTNQLKRIVATLVCIGTIACIPLLAWFDFGIALLGCAIFFVLAGTVYYKSEKRKAEMEAFAAIGRVNDELQLTSAERDKTLIELKKHKKFLGSILSAIPQSIFWKDTNCKYQGCNQRFARDAGFSSPDEIVGKTDHDLVWTKEQADSLVKCDKEILKTGIPLLNMEQRLIRADGKAVKLLVSKAPLRKEDGKVTGILGIYSDITATKQPEQKTETDGPTATEAISCMVQGVAITDQDGRILEVNRCFLEIVGKKTEDIVGEFVFDCMPGDSKGMVKETVEGFKKTYRLEAKTSSQTIDGKIFDIRVQPIQKNRGFVGAVISLIDISKLAQRKQQAENNNNRTLGFLAEISYKIRTLTNSIAGFTDLLREESLTDKQTEFVDIIYSSAKSLLGVAEDVTKSNIDTPKGLAERKTENFEDNDNCSDHSKTYRIPQKNAETDTPKVARKATKQVRGDRASVLVVDDVTENSMLIDVILSKAGYKVTCCSNGKEAVEIAQKEKFDVILMDIQMPVMDGLEATRIIKLQGINANTTIAAMTARSVAGSESASFKAGCDDYLEKPIRKELLLQRVQRFVEQSKQLDLANNGSEITSFLSCNPDYYKTIEMFVNNLPDKIKEIQEALDENNLQALAFKVHALRGVGGFAGFPVYTEKAKAIEQTIGENNLEEVCRQVEELTKMCERTKLTHK